MNLPTFHHPPCHLLQARSTLLAVLGSMSADLICPLGKTKRLPTVALLSSAFFATGLAQAVGFATQPITGRGFTAIMAIFFEPPFQLMDPSQSLLEQLLVVSLHSLQLLLEAGLFFLSWFLLRLHDPILPHWLSSSLLLGLLTLPSFFESFPSPTSRLTWAVTNILLFSLTCVRSSEDAMVYST